MIVMHPHSWDLQKPRSMMLVAHHIRSGSHGYGWKPCYRVFKSQQLNKPDQKNMLAMADMAISCYIMLYIMNSDRYINRCIYIYIIIYRYVMMYDDIWRMYDENMTNIWWSMWIVMNCISPQRRRSATETCSDLSDELLSILTRGDIIPSWWLTYPSWKMMEFLNGKMVHQVHPIYEMEHQIPWFQTTGQILIYNPSQWTKWIYI